MGFFRTINKAKGFLNKSIDKSSGFMGKVINGVEKGVGVAHKVLDIAGDVANKLSGVPIVGALASEVQPFINQGKQITNVAGGTASRLEKLNNKLGKVHIA
jgi:hypothetical protein